MAFPITRAEMRAQKYRFADHGHCDGCMAAIEWWITPRGKNIPMDPMPTDESAAVSHWATCPDVNAFRKKKK
jgi:hypothetical protein